jgi:uncharacterized protein (DUF983 family)
MSSPWEHLDPGSDPDPSASPQVPEPAPKAGRRRNEPGATKALFRGATKRCPRCGSGGLFKSWFTIRQRCPRCGWRLEREEGGFLGAMTLNYVFTAIVWVLLLVVWLIVDLPDLHVAALTVASIAVAVLVPLLFWPVSKTIWASVDYLIDRANPDYGSRQAADRAEGNGSRAG